MFDICGDCNTDLCQQHFLLKCPHWMTPNTDVPLPQPPWPHPCAPPSVNSLVTLVPQIPTEMDVCNVPPAMRAKGGVKEDELSGINAKETCDRNTCQCKGEVESFESFGEVTGFFCKFHRDLMDDTNDGEKPLGAVWCAKDSFPLRPATGLGV